jgi:hypothetical protein
MGKIEFSYYGTGESTALQKSNRGRNCPRGADLEAPGRNRVGMCGESGGTEMALHRRGDYF